MECRHALPLAALAVLAGRAAVAQTVIHPTRDGTVYRATVPGQTYPDGVFANANTSSLFWVRQGGSNCHRGYMVFDLAGLAGRRIVSAKFEFTEENTANAPIIEVYGGYEPGEWTYERLLAFNTGGETRLEPSAGPFANMTSEGTLLGQVSLPAGGGVKSVDVGAPYFQSQVGNLVLLVARVQGDLDPGWRQHGSDGGGAPWLRIDATCYADCDTSTGLGTLDIFDFLCFQNRFAANDPYACDCDRATGPGVCDIFDFLCFQNAFAAGCP